jgi:dTDP-4-amino-4,6-dideoxygalactose transaminase
MAAQARDERTHDVCVRFGALERQHAVIEDQLRDAFDRVLRGNSFILGEEVERFEEEFARYCQTEHCVGVSSGTAALSLMLRASGIGPGDEVIVPAHTFIASALAVSHVGALPVLCDVHKGSGLIDADAARALVGPKTAAIIAVHLYGQACDIPAIEEFARPHGLLVLEDAAQAHGARYGGQTVGSLGAAAAFSFYPSKNLGALGDGGAIVTDDDDLAAHARRLRFHGSTDKATFTDVGYNSRLDALQAAVLRLLLPDLDGWNEARREVARAYARNGLGDVHGIELPDWEDAEHVFHLYVVRSDRADDLLETLTAREVGARAYYRRPVHEQPAMAAFPPAVDLPGTAEAARTHLALPMGPLLDERAIDEVIAACASG